MTTSPTLKPRMLGETARLAQVRGIWPSRWTVNLNADTEVMGPCS
jgi:hypothetical protein